MKKSIFTCLLLGLLSTVHSQVSDFNHIDLKKADSVAKVRQGADLKNLPLLSYQLTVGLNTDVEKFRAIYKWVCNNIANDYGMYLKNKGKRHKFRKDSLKLDSWNSQFSKTVFEKLLKEKKTICTGYAYLIKELSNLADLDCVIIDGFGLVEHHGKKTESPNHSWNAVKLNDTWYLCDATWASGLSDARTYEFTFAYNDEYFLMEPATFLKDHEPIDDHWTLMNKKKIADEPSLMTSN